MSEWLSMSRFEYKEEQWQAKPRAQIQLETQVVKPGSCRVQHVGTLSNSSRWHSQKDWHERTTKMETEVQTKMLLEVQVECGEIFFEGPEVSWLIPIKLGHWTQKILDTKSLGAALGETSEVSSRYNELSSAEFVINYWICKIVALSHVHKHCNWHHRMQDNSFKVVLTMSSTWETEVSVLWRVIQSHKLPQFSQLERGKC